MPVSESFSGKSKFLLLLFLYSIVAIYILPVSSHIYYQYPPMEDTGSIYIAMILEEKIYSNASKGEVYP